MVATDAARAICHSPPTRKKMAAAAAKLIPDTTTMRAMTMPKGICRSGEAGSCSAATGVSCSRSCDVWLPVLTSAGAPVAAAAGPSPARVGVPAVVAARYFSSPTGALPATAFIVLHRSLAHRIRQSGWAAFANPTPSPA